MDYHYELAFGRRRSTATISRPQEPAPPHAVGEEGRAGLNHEELERCQMRPNNAKKKSIRHLPLLASLYCGSRQ